METVTEEPTYRYCTEIMVKEVHLQKELLKKQLEQQGDSLILAGNQRLLKIHIHTNNPQAVLSMVERYGQVTQQKVDDMLLQFEVTKARKYPIALVTDSVADLPAEFLLKEQIHVLPMNILIDDQSYLDKLTINGSGIQEKALTASTLSTAQPAVRSVDALLSFLEDKYEAVLVITVASKLSGTYQLLKQRIAAKQWPAEKIQVIDSKLNSAAQGLLVQEAVRQLRKGGSLQEVAAAVTGARQRCFIYVAVADLEPMLRSGRIPKGVGRLAQNLHLFPIVCLNAAGEGKLKGIAFTQRQSERKIVKSIERLKKKNQVTALAITHANNAAEAQRMRQALSADEDESGVNGGVDFVVESSAVIAISAGSGSVAVAGILKEEEQ